MAEDRVIQIFVSLEILQEINRVLEYEKILRILKRSRMEPSSIMTTIVSLSSLVDAKATVKVIEEDPSDNGILSCAMEAGAQFVLSGDHHLLQLGSYDDIMILSASRFLEMQEGSVTRSSLLAQAEMNCTHDIGGYISHRPHYKSRPRLVSLLQR